MKAVKLVRLLEKDAKGLYKKDGHHEVLRTRIEISEASIEETEASFHETGLLYIVLEEEIKEAPAKEAKTKL